MRDLDEKPCPMLHLTSKDLPEIKKWKVGQTYDLVLKVKQVGANINTYDSILRGDFEILKVKPVESKSENYDKSVVKKAVSMIRS